MSLEIHPASPKDAPELAQVFYASFRTDCDKTMFPNTPDVTEWFERFFSADITRSIEGETRDVFLKVTEGSEDGGDRIVAFAKWKFPVPADRNRHEEQIVWPASSDKELCDRFFNGMEARHEKWMGERPHYCTFFFFFFKSLGLVFLEQIRRNTTNRYRSGYVGCSRFLPGQGTGLETP